MKISQDNTTADKVLKFVTRVLVDRDLQTKIKDSKIAPVILQEAGLPDSARDHLLQIMNLQEHLGAKEDFGNGNQKLRNRSSERQDQPRDGFADLAKTVLASFRYVASSFWISLAMSVIIFLIGVGFLLGALFKAFDEREASTSTLTLAGVGLANFLLLFYKGPWKDIAANLVNTERARTATLSYLGTMSYIRQLDQSIAPLEAIEAIRDLTRETVSLLENVHKEDIRRPSKKAETKPNTDASNNLDSKLSSSATAPSNQAPLNKDRSIELDGSTG